MHAHTQILATPQYKGHCGGREGLPASSWFEVLLLQLLRKLEFAEANLEARQPGFNPSSHCLAE